jgi:hypothetical protein
MLARLHPHRRIIIAAAVAVNAILAIALATSASASQPTAMACFSTQNCFCEARFACRVGGVSHQCTTNSDCTT